MNKELDLLCSCYGVVKNLKYEMAILPWGAIEPHNYHLPYLTDCILSHDVALEAAEKAKEIYGIRCMVMPPVYYGSQNPGQRELPFCVHARYETQKAILTDIVASLYCQGLRRLVIINGHGGNSFKNMIRDLAIDYPDFLIAVSDWFSALPAAKYFTNPGDHADEVETAVMMYYRPALVDITQAGNGNSKEFKATTLNEKLAWTPRDWSRVSEDTGIGNPKGATAEMGRNFATAIAQRYAKLFYELSQSSIYEG